MIVSVTPPKVLTMEEYERDWKPQGWQMIIIGPTSTWRQDWSEWEAIRDIVQNALDETENYSWGFDDDGLYIRDAGKGIAVADFLLGPPKLKPEHARGRFGEGMKIAALALLRLGYAVRVETVGRDIWIIFIEQKTNGHAQTLAALWRPGGRRYGTVFHIIGYHDSAFDDRFAVNLPRKATVAEGPSLLHQPIRRFNQLIRHEFADGASRIYARDIYMKDIVSPYSYNLWSFELAPDRHAPKDESEMWADIGRLWCCVTKAEHLEVFLKMVTAPPVVETDESHNMNMNPWEMGREPVTGKDYASFIQENASVWQESWRKVTGDDPPSVLRTDDRWDSMVSHLGYRSASVLYSVKDALAGAIITDRALIRASQERLREVEVVPEERLDVASLAHLKLAREIAGRVFPYSPPSGVHVAMIPAASDRVRTAGMYSTATGEVYIAMEQMGRFRKVIDTLVHELGHHRQYVRYQEAQDLTPLHMESMQEVAAEVVRITASTELDHLFREVTW